MLEQHDGRVQCQRASKPDAENIRRSKLSNRSIERRLLNPGVGRKCHDPFSHFRRWRFDFQRVRHREVLHDGQRVEQHRSAADDADPVDDLHPLLGVLDVRGRTAEQANRAALGQGGASDKVDEHFRGHLIEAYKRHLFTSGDAETRNSEGAKPVIVLRDVSQLENRRCHDWILLFTSSTIRDEAASASTSIFTAARLQTIAPYASIPWTIGGSTPVSTLAPRMAAAIVAAIANVPIEKTGLRAAAIWR